MLEIQEFEEINSEIDLIFLTNIAKESALIAVSYTHLTLPTIYSV